MRSRPNVFSNDANRQQMLIRHIGTRLDDRPYAIVWVRENALPKSQGFNWPSKRPCFRRILLVFEGLPIALDSLKHWRRWAIDAGALDVLVEFVRIETSEQESLGLLDRRCGKWFDPVPLPETPALKIRSHIALGTKMREKDDPDLLTMMFGSMGELLTRIDLIRLRFRETYAVAHATRDDYLKIIDTLIGGNDRNGQADTPPLKSGSPDSHLPRLLLRGDTGVGKTLIARYLQDETDVRPPRIPIPEYLGKEDMFEYDLFGYVHGAYTDGKEEGDHGLLLENVGGVVFLDEIGEANEIIQAKLLAYLDDYRVRPRGWRGTPFHCPTLIVAATNRDLNAMAKKGRFRGDLLARFTDVETIPPLRERRESLPFILDCLLQNDAINPGAAVQEIGQDAFAAVEKHEFSGNFRELEDTLRTACIAATRDGRKFLCRRDLRF